MTLRIPAVTLALLIGMIGCGDDDDFAGEAPRIDSVRDETGDGIAVIGENLTLVGVFDTDARVEVGGIEASLVSADDPDGITVRVPPGVEPGVVEVIAENAQGPSEAVAFPLRRLVYTADFTDRSLSVLSLEGSSLGLIGTVEVDVAPGPFAVRFTPDGRTAVVACGIGFLPDSIIDALAPGAPPGDSVAIVDVVAGETVAVLRTGEDSIPTGVAIHRDGETAYVTNYGANTVSVIDLVERRVVLNIEVPRQPEEMALRPDGAYLLVNSVGGTVSTIDTETLEVVATVTTGDNDPSGVAWSADGSTGHVAHSYTDPSFEEDGTVVALDLSDPTAPSVVSSFGEDIGPTAYDIDLVPGTDMAVVTNINVIFTPLSIGAGSISILDFASDPPAVRTVEVGTAPIRASVSGDGTLALVGNALDQTVSVVDLAGGVLSTVELPTTIGPSDVAIQP